MHLPLKVLDFKSCKKAKNEILNLFRGPAKKGLINYIKTKL